MAPYLYLIIILFLAGACNSRENPGVIKDMAGLKVETSDIVISDSAAEQTNKIKIGGAVLVPSHMILENMQAPDNVQLFKQMIDESSLKKVLEGKGPFTLFIPTDAAFKKIKNLNLNLYLQKGSTEEKETFIKQHLVSGKIVAADLQDRVILKAANGEEITVHNDGKSITLNKAKILVKDGVSNNGVIHFVDSVILPEAE